MMDLFALAHSAGLTFRDAGIGRGLKPWSTSVLSSSLAACYSQTGSGTKSDTTCPACPITAAQPIVETDPGPCTSTAPQTKMFRHSFEQRLVV